jgi:DNA-binding response OmpR family regulator
MKLDKIMVVGSEIPRSLNPILRASRSVITIIPSGELAVARAEREMFDAVILLSTGEEMDLTETVFNLSDINHSMELIILSDHTTTNNSAVLRNVLAHFVSKATVMTTQELEKHLNWI